MNKCNSFLPITIWFVTILFLLSVPILGMVQTANALTPDEIIKLKEAGISDEVIVEMIKKDKDTKKGPKKMTKLDRFLQPINANDFDSILKRMEATKKLVSTGHIRKQIRSTVSCRGYADFYYEAAKCLQKNDSGDTNIVFTIVDNEDDDENRYKLNFCKKGNFIHIEVIEGKVDIGKIPDDF